MSQNVPYFARNRLPKQSKQRTPKKKRRYQKSLNQKKEVKILKFPITKNEHNRELKHESAKPIKYEGQTFHHLIPKSRAGKREPANGLYLWEKRHRWWHTLFGVMTPLEIIEYLKTSHRVSPEDATPVHKTKTWVKLFGERSPLQVIKIITRILRMKKKGLIRKKHAIKFLRRKAA